LLYQFSRYLYIAGSRPGSQPLGLQGIWSNHVIPPWNGAYTVNINAEMNYWNVLRGNLTELHEPFLRSISECLPNGRKVAREMYGLDGWCMHHNISIWRTCAPVDGRAGDGARTSFWNMGAGWFMQHVWEHYLFTQDTAVLETYYTAMLEAARFYSQWLVDRGDGILWTPVGGSPENAFLVDGTKAAMLPGPTMDMAIIRECYTNLLQASEILRKEDPAARYRPRAAAAAFSLSGRTIRPAAGVEFGL
jgi:alpha-L-fucosidase 2